MRRRRDVGDILAVVLFDWLLGLDVMSRVVEQREDDVLETNND